MSCKSCKQDHGWFHAAPGTMRCLYCGATRPANHEERRRAGETDRKDRDIRLRR